MSLQEEDRSFGLFQILSHRLLHKNLQIKYKREDSIDLSIDASIILKLIFEVCMWMWGMDWNGTGRSLVTDYCEHGNEYGKPSFNAGLSAAYSIIRVKIKANKYLRNAENLSYAVCYIRGSGIWKILLLFKNAEDGLVLARTGRNFNYFRKKSIQRRITTSQNENVPFMLVFYPKPSISTSDMELDA
jgi:hypothetical protein